MFAARGGGAGRLLTALGAGSEAGLSLADGDARALAGAFEGKARGTANYREFLFAAARKQGFKGKWTKGALAVHPPLRAVQPAPHPVAHPVTPTDNARAPGSLTSLQGMFARFDVDNNGRLEKQEFRRAAEAAGLKLQPWYGACGCGCRADVWALTGTPLAGRWRA